MFLLPRKNTSTSRDFLGSYLRCRWAIIKNEDIFSSRRFRFRRDFFDNFLRSWVITKNPTQGLPSPTKPTLFAFSMSYLTSPSSDRPQSTSLCRSPCPDWYSVFTFTNRQTQEEKHEKSRGGVLHSERALVGNPPIKVRMANDGQTIKRLLTFSYTSGIILLLP